jgi:hypothetical protein
VQSVSNAMLDAELIASVSFEPTTDQRGSKFKIGFQRELTEGCRVSEARSMVRSLFEQFKFGELELDLAELTGVDGAGLEFFVCAASSAKTEGATRVNVTNVPLEIGPLFAAAGIPFRDAKDGSRP